MKKKRVAAILLAVVLAWSMTACGSGGSAAETASASAGEAGDLLTRIQARGEIVVAMEGTWAPWTYHDESDALVGYDVEVARKIAEKLGVQVRFVEGEWDGLLSGWTPDAMILWSTAWILPRSGRKSMISPCPTPITARR